MIGALLTRIGGLFEKSYLFASFLPALIFLASVTLTLVGVAGAEGISAWVDSWAALQKTAVSAIAGVVVIVVGYLLHGLRPFFTRLWSGNIEWLALQGFVWIGVQLQTRQFDRLRRRSHRISPWSNVFRDFREAAKLKWSQQHPLIPDDERRKLMDRVRNLREDFGPERAKQQVQPLLDAYGKFSIDSLMPIYREVHQRFVEWDERERARVQRDAAILDRWFGTRATIKATRLGNLIDAFNRYPHSRYGMEVEIFWPRLEHTASPTFLAKVHDQQTLLDFSLTLASVATLYAILAVLAGPWLWYYPSLWMALAVLALAVARFAYTMAIDAADELGDLVRAAYDLFRLDLMQALSLEPPASIAAERTAWKRFSELVVYGELPDDVKLRTPPDASAPKASTS